MPNSRLAYVTPPVREVVAILVVLFFIDYRYPRHAQRDRHYGTVEARA